MMQLKLIAIVLSFLVLSPSFFSQPQTAESLADVARKAREARKNQAPATTKLTNDSNASGKPGTAGIPPPISQPAAVGPYVLKTVPKYWPNCAAATAELGEEKPTGHMDQEVDAKVSGSSSQSNGIWTFSGATTVKSSLVVNLPEWVNIPDDPTIHDSWQKLIKALRSHEEGHVNIATEALQSLIGRTITGSGSSAVLAQQDAQRQFDQLTHSVESATLAKQNQYDAITDHGRKQSAIGGTDITFACH